MPLPSLMLAIAARGAGKLSLSPYQPSVVGTLIGVQPVVGNQMSHFSRMTHTWSPRRP